MVRGGGDLPPLEALEGQILLSGVPFNYTTLDFPGSAYTQATGINDLGQIVGAYGEYPNNQAYLLSSSFVDLEADRERPGG